MQIFRLKFKSKARRVFGCFIFFVALNTIAAQNQAVPPTAPIAPVAPTPPAAPINSVQMPQMPAISAPPSGTTLYVPGQRAPQQKSDSQKPAQAEEKKPAAPTLEQLTIENNNFNLDNLTAWDLTQLAQRGALRDFTLNQLVGNNLGANIGSNIEGLSNKRQEKALEKILLELQQIKEAQSNLQAAPQTNTAPSGSPKILRFAINSRDILSSCTQVFFSKRELDGSFLLTGDARTTANNSTVAETFYILFQARGFQNNRQMYEVSARLSQNAQSNTPLKAFCETASLTATRTGNLVVLNHKNGAEIFDLLLDIGSPASSQGGVSQNAQELANARR